MKFSQSHEWIEVKEGIGKVGISMFAQQELGQVVYIEFPKVGQQIQAGEECAILESTKAAVDIYSPVSGKVLEINPLLCEQVDLINRAPEGEGWIYKIELSQPAELHALLTKQDYERILA